MTGSDIAQRRLGNQSIAPAASLTPGEVVKRLGAVQAQDYLGALWALGLRMQRAVEADIEQAIANREIIRTWPMRGTLHFVAAEDVRWMLALLTPRILARAARRHQQLALDEATFARSETLFTNALENGRSLTRNQMMDVLEQAGISTKGQRGYHILGWAAQNGLICFGPRQGKQHTFVLLDEWLPSGKSLSREEALAELAHRYFTGHGPATIQDFIWWSGLPAALPGPVWKWSNRSWRMSSLTISSIGFGHRHPPHKLPRQLPICCPHSMSICWGIKIAAPCSTRPMLQKSCLAVMACSNRLL